MGMWGIERCGNAVPIPPKRVPMVATGKWTIATRPAPTTTAIRKPGQFGLKRRNAMIRTRLPAVSATVVPLKL